jgi:beta-lactamase class D
MLQVSFFTRSISQSLATGKIIVKPELKNHFVPCQADGVIVIYDKNKQQWIMSDSADANKETLPASTFKIINLLIALETNVITDVNEVVPWPGSTDTVKYGYRPDIYHDMSVKEAFAVSAGWVFVELAKKIGRENYQKYLRLSRYGNLDLSQNDPDFWNFGAFAISPINQVMFLKDLYSGKLPFAKQNMAIVKNVMLTEQNKEYTLGSKTGWTRENGINTGWWVGYLERKEGVYFFATRLLQDRKINSANFGSCRKESTLSILKALKLLN